MTKVSRERCPVAVAAAAGGGGGDEGANHRAR